MMLYVNGSDIARVVLGVLDDGASAFLVDPVVIDASPEQFLARVDEFLKSHEGSMTGIVAVLGPGSATALRTSLTMVNALAFAKSIPTFGVELAPGADDRSFLVSLHGASPVPMARPVYTAPAKITVSTKDALGRR